MSALPCLPQVRGALCLPCLPSPRFVARDPGTYWWHSHAGLQRSNGLFGHLVVRQPPSRDPHSALYDRDLPQHVLSLTDWLVEMTANRFAAHHHDDGDNKPASMLINGQR